MLSQRPSSQAEPSSSRTHALVSLDQFGRSGVTASSSSLITSASMPALLPSARRHLPEDAADALDWRLSVMQQLLLSGSTQLAARQSAAEETVRTILFRWRYRDEFLALQSLKANAKRERLLYGGVLAVLPSRRGRMLEALFTMRGAAAAAPSGTALRSLIARVRSCSLARALEAWQLDAESARVRATGRRAVLARVLSSLLAAARRAAAAQHASLVCAQASSREALSAWREALPALRAERADRCARREHREHARRRAQQCAWSRFRYEQRVASHSHSPGHSRLAVRVGWSRWRRRWAAGAARVGRYLRLMNMANGTSAARLFARWSARVAARTARDDSSAQAAVMHFVGTHRATFAHWRTRVAEWTTREVFFGQAAVVYVRTTHRAAWRHWKQHAWSEYQRRTLRASLETQSRRFLWRRLCRAIGAAAQRRRMRSTAARAQARREWSRLCAALHASGRCARAGRRGAEGAEAARLATLRSAWEGLADAASTHVRADVAFACVRAATLGKALRGAWERLHLYSSAWVQIRLMVVVRGCMHALHRWILSAAARATARQVAQAGAAHARRVRLCVGLGSWCDQHGQRRWHESRQRVAAARVHEASFERHARAALLCWRRHRTSRVHAAVARRHAAAAEAARAVHTWRECMRGAGPRSALAEAAYSAHTRRAVLSALLLWRAVVAQRHAAAIVAQNHRSRARAQKMAVIRRWCLVTTLAAAACVVAHRHRWRAEARVMAEWRFNLAWNDAAAALMRRTVVPRAQRLAAALASALEYWATLVMVEHGTYIMRGQRFARRAWERFCAGSAEVGAERSLYAAACTQHRHLAWHQWRAGSAAHAVRQQQHREQRQRAGQHLASARLRDWRASALWHAHWAEVDRALSSSASGTATPRAILAAGTATPLATTRAAPSALPPSPPLMMWSPAQPAPLPALASPSRSSTSAFALTPLQSLRERRERRERHQAWALWRRSAAAAAQLQRLWRRQDDSSLQRALASWQALTDEVSTRRGATGAVVGARERRQQLSVFLCWKLQVRCTTSKVIVQLRQRQWRLREQLMRWRRETARRAVAFAIRRRHAWREKARVVHRWRAYVSLRHASHELHAQAAGPLARKHRAATAGALAEWRYEVTLAAASCVVRHRSRWRLYDRLLRQWRTHLALTKAADAVQERAYAACERRLSAVTNDALHQWADLARADWAVVVVEQQRRGRRALGVWAANGAMVSAETDQHEGLLALAETHLRLSRLRAWAAIARHQAARREEAAARASPAEAALAAMAEVLAAAHVAAGLGLDTSAPSTAPVTPAPATVPATPAPSTPAAAAPFSAGISPAFYPASGAFSDAPTFEASAFGEASFGQATPTFDEGPAFDDAAPCGEAFAFGQASAFGEPPAFDESAAFGQAFAFDDAAPFDEAAAAAALDAADAFGAAASSFSTIASWAARGDAATFEPVPPKQPPPQPSSPLPPPSREKEALEVARGAMLELEAVRRDYTAAQALAARELEGREEANARASARALVEQRVRLRAEFEQEKEAALATVRLQSEAMQSPAPVALAQEAAKGEGGRGRATEALAQEAARQQDRPFATVTPEVAILLKSTPEVVSLQETVEEAADTRGGRALGGDDSFVDESSDDGLSTFAELRMGWRRWAAATKAARAQVVVVLLRRRCALAAALRHWAVVMEAAKHRRHLVLGTALGAWREWTAAEVHRGVLRSLAARHLLAAMTMESRTARRSALRRWGCVVSLALRRHAAARLAPSTLKRRAVQHWRREAHVWAEWQHLAMRCDRALARAMLRLWCRASVQWRRATLVLVAVMRRSALASAVLAIGWWSGWSRTESVVRVWRERLLVTRARRMLLVWRVRGAEEDAIEATLRAGLTSGSRASSPAAFHVSAKPG